MVILPAAILIWLYMTAWYLLSIVKKRNDIADVAWGLGFIVITAFTLVGNPTLTLGISFILISIWGLRLATHIYLRNKNKKEDSRYSNFKQNPYFKVFIVQGFFMWLISFPILGSSNTLSWTTIAGILIWMLGFYFEATADKQLRTFIRNPGNKGKIMQTGLWAYSRHPNYFGEVTMWWGIWLLNLGNNWWTIIGPATITFLITKVSGVPLLEKKYEDNAEFKKYKNRVSVFIPWWPKRTSK